MIVRSCKGVALPMTDAGAARTLKTLELHGLRAFSTYGRTVACLYESEPPVEFSQLESLVFKHCFLCVIEVVEFLHHADVVFPRLKEAMMDQGESGFLSSCVGVSRERATRARVNLRNSPQTAWRESPSVAFEQGQAP
jgi:hypothetical protein